MIRRTRVQSFKQYSQEEIDCWNDFKANIEGYFPQCDPEVIKSVKNILAEIENRNIPNMTIPAVYSGYDSDRIYISWGFNNSIFYFKIEKDLFLTEKSSHDTVSSEWYFSHTTDDTSEGGDFSVDDQLMWNCLSILQFSAPSISPLLKIR